MRHATFIKPTLTGLQPGELRATGVADLSAPHRAALIAIAIAGGVKPKGRIWLAGTHPDPITDRTVAALRARGLIGGGRRRPSGATDKGRWYVRSIVSDLAIQNINPEEAALCLAIEY